MIKDEILLVFIFVVFLVFIFLFGILFFMVFIFVICDFCERIKFKLVKIMIWVGIVVIIFVIVV